MGFALAIASFFKANVRLATGTGCFICFMTMLALSFSFIRYARLPAPHRPAPREPRHS